MQDWDWLTSQDNVSPGDWWEVLETCCKRRLFRQSQRVCPRRFIVRKHVLKIHTNIQLKRENKQDFLSRILLPGRIVKKQKEVRWNECYEELRVRSVFCVLKDSVCIPSEKQTAAILAWNHCVHGTWRSDFLVQGQQISDLHNTHSTEW